MHRRAPLYALDGADGISLAGNAVAQLASSTAVAAIPLLYTTVGLELWQLMALVFVGALLDTPGSVARAALLPDPVELAGVRSERASGIRGDPAFRQMDRAS